jgi:hypothetical protein
VRRGRSEKRPKYRANISRSFLLLLKSKIRKNIPVSEIKEKVQATLVDDTDVCGAIVIFID